MTHRGTLQPVTMTEALAMSTSIRSTVGHAICALAVSVPLVALGAAAQASPWVEVGIPEEGQGTYEALHFITADEGWVLSLRNDGRERLRLDTFDGGETWDVQPISEEDYRVLHRARFADPLNGWAPSDLTGSLDFPRIDGHNPGEDNGIDAPVNFRRTTDGGRTWRMAQGVLGNVTHFGDLALAREADRKYVSAVSFANSRVGAMAGPVAATRRGESGDFVIYRGHCLLRTQDGGATWDMHVYGDMMPNDRYDPTWGPLRQSGRSRSSGNGTRVYQPLARPVLPSSAPTTAGRPGRQSQATLGTAPQPRSVALCASRVHSTGGAGVPSTV